MYTENKPVQKCKDGNTMKLESQNGHLRSLSITENALLLSQSKPILRDYPTEKQKIVQVSISEKVKHTVFGAHLTVKTNLH